MSLREEIKKVLMEQGDDAWRNNKGYNSSYPPNEWGQVSHYFDRTRDRRQELLALFHKAVESLAGSDYLLGSRGYEECRQAVLELVKEE